MAGHGPARRPKALEEAMGSPRKQAPIVEIPYAGKLVKPDFLQGRASEIWDEETPNIEAVDGLAKAVDSRVLGMWCQKWAEYEECLADVRDNGYEYTTATGYLRDRPSVRRLEKVEPVIIRLSQEYGFTPSSRARINFVDIPVGGSGEQGTFDALLFGDGWGSDVG